MHPTDPNAFACDMDPTCTFLEYREKKVCPNYVTDEEWNKGFLHKQHNKNKTAQ